MDQTTERRAQDRLRNIRRTSQRALRTILALSRSVRMLQNSGVCKKEAEQSVLGPIAIVSTVGIGLGEESAMAAMVGCD
jgi:hypothetical protein